MSLSKEKILSTLNDNKKYLSDKFGVKSISLFGSYARDTQNESSYIDLMVDFDSVSFDKIAGLQIYLERIFNKKVDILRKGSRIKKRKIENIHKELINV